MILSLDLLSRLTEELGSEIEPHISPSNLMQLLLDSMKYPYPEVLQFAFGLLGALTKICFQHVFPFIRNVSFLSTKC